MASSLGIWQGSWGHIAATILLIVLATLAVALRFWSRQERRRRISSSGIHADDWLVLAALVINYGLSITVFVAFLADGLGFNANYLGLKDPHAASEVKKLTFIGTVLYGTAATCIRLSVILFYFRVFPAKTVRCGAYAIATICLLWFVSIEALNLAACKPIASSWDNPKKCGPVQAGVITLGSISVAINAFIVGLPAREISKLNLSGERRFLVMIFFLIGGIVTIASLARLVSVTIFVMHESNATSALPSTTIGYEIYLAIVGACAPTLGPVYNKARNRPSDHEDMPIPHHSNRRSAYTTKPGGGRRSHQHQQSTAAIITHNITAHLSRTALRESDDEERPFKQRFNDDVIPHHHVLVPPKERGDFWTDISARPASGGVPLGGIRVQRDVTWNAEEE